MTPEEIEKSFEIAKHRGENDHNLYASRETNDKFNKLEVAFARLDEKVGFVLTEVKNLRDGTYNDIAMLKKDKADRAEVHPEDGIDASAGFKRWNIRPCRRL